MDDLPDDSDEVNKLFILNYSSARTSHAPRELSMFDPVGIEAATSKIVSLQKIIV
jgi:hypothetical protein